MAIEISDPELVAEYLNIDNPKMGAARGKKSSSLNVIVNHEGLEKPLMFTVNNAKAFAMQLYQTAQYVEENPEQFPGVN